MQPTPLIREEDRQFFDLASCFNETALTIQKFDKTGGLIRESTKDTLLNSIQLLKKVVENIRFHFPFDPNVPELPQEIWTRIFTELDDIKQWAKVKTVCRAWQNNASLIAPYVNRLAKTALIKINYRSDRETAKKFQ